MKRKILITLFVLIISTVSKSQVDKEDIFYDPLFIKWENWSELLSTIKETDRFKTCRLKGINCLDCNFINVQYIFVDNELISYIIYYTRDEIQNLKNLLGESVMHKKDEFYLWELKYSSLFYLIKDNELIVTIKNN